MNCRICRNKISKIIDFGKISLVGKFLKKKNNDTKHKISLNFCNFCKHVQIAEKINPNLLFKNYLWETGISKINIKIINDIISQIKKKFSLNKKSKIFEIACNDGSFLKAIKKFCGCYVVGIDPAKNLLSKNKNKDIIRISDFFNFKISKKIKINHGEFDFIFARNVLAHINDPNEIFKGVKNLIKFNGVFILEFPSLLNIIKYNQYDNIFHEHIGYHSLKSIQDLCKIHKLKLIDLDIIDSQGGSIRCYISTINNSLKPKKKIIRYLNLEKNYKILSKKRLYYFKNEINSHKKEMLNLLLELKKKNKKISIYGASGKGQALMQFCGINNKIIDFVFDRSKLKINKYTPGTNIKIVDPKKLNKLKPDYLLLLTWNLKKEIMKQEKLFLKRGGKFIIPFPKPKVVVK